MKNPNEDYSHQFSIELHHKWIEFEPEKTYT